MPSGHGASRSTSPPTSGGARCSPNSAPAPPRGSLRPVISGRLRRTVRTSRFSRLHVRASRLLPAPSPCAGQGPPTLLLPNRLHGGSHVETAPPRLSVALGAPVGILSGPSQTGDGALGLRSASHAAPEGGAGVPSFGIAPAHGTRRAPVPRGTGALRRRLLSDRFADGAQERFDVATQEAQGDDRNNRDEGEDECVLREPLPLLVGNEERRDKCVRTMEEKTRGRSDRRYWFGRAGALVRSRSAPTVSTHPCSVADRQVPPAMAQALWTAVVR